MRYNDICVMLKKRPCAGRIQTSSFYTNSSEKTKTKTIHYTSVMRGLKRYIEPGDTIAGTVVIYLLIRAIKTGIKNINVHYDTYASAHGEK